MIDPNSHEEAIAIDSQYLFVLLVHCAGFASGIIARNITSSMKHTSTCTNNTSNRINDYSTIERYFKRCKFSPADAVNSMQDEVVLLLLRCCLENCHPNGIVGESQSGLDSDWGKARVF
jgi:hypothetical protein